MTISNVLALLSGLALFLFGVTLMGDSLNRVAGGKLEAVLYRLTNRPIKGILLAGGGLSLIYPGLLTDVIGLGVIALVIVIQILMRNRERHMAAA